MIHLQPCSRKHSIDGLFFPEAQLYAVPAALALISQLISDLIRKADLKVSQAANDNTRETLKEHIEGHRRNEILREKCRMSYIRTFLKTKDHLNDNTCP